METSSDFHLILSTNWLSWGYGSMKQLMNFECFESCFVYFVRLQNRLYANMLRTSHQIVIYLDFNSRVYQRPSDEMCQDFLFKLNFPAEFELILQENSYSYAFQLSYHVEFSLRLQVVAKSFSNLSFPSFFSQESSEFNHQYVP